MSAAWPASSRGSISAISRASFVAFGLREVAPAAVADPHELDQPAALGAVEAHHVIAGEHRDLGGGEQLEHGNPPHPRDVAGGAAERTREQSVGHCAESRGAAG